MKELILCDKPTIERLAQQLKQANSHSQYQRIQCVLLRATLGSSAAQIAQLPGWSRATVHVIHSCWARQGDAIFDLRARGGRRHEHLSVEHEAQVLAPLIAKANAGGMLKVALIQRAYEHKIGKAVAPSTVYRLLERHGWRKGVPRPRHPRADAAAQAAFKKLRPLLPREVARQAQPGRRVRLMFQDERRFGLLGTPRRCWAPRGTRLWSASSATP